MHRTCILLRCGKTLTADALLGCFLPWLGPLAANAGSPFIWFISLQAFDCWLVLFAMTSWLLRHEIKLFTDDVSCDKLLIGGKPLAADALFGRFLP